MSSEQWTLEPPDDDALVTPARPIPNQFAEAEANPLTRYWGVVFKHLPMILVVAVAIFALVAVYTYRQPKIYEARTTIVIELKRPQVLGSDVQPVVDMSPADFWNSSQFFETQYKIIQSRALAQKVVDRLGLADDLVFLGLDGVEDQDELEKALGAIDPVNVLIRSLEIEPAIESRIVGLKFRHRDPETAMTVCNAIAETYQQLNAEDKMESTGRAHRWLTSQYTDIKKRLEASDRKLYEFKEENKILTTSLEDRQNITSQQLLELSSRLTSLRADRVKVQAEAGQMRRIRNAEDLRSASIDEVIGNPLVQALKTSHTELKRKEADLVGNKRLDDNPELIAVRKQLAIVETDMDREIGTILSTADTRLRIIQTTEGGVKKQLEEIKLEALELNKKELKYSELSREHEDNERLYSIVLKRLKETDLSRFLKDNNVRLLDTAELPESPVLPRVWLNLLIGAILGGVVAVGLAFVREMMDSTIRTQEDVENVLGLTFLGLIPTFKPETERGSDQELVDLPDLHVHNFPKSSAAECCRTIRTNLMFMAPGQKLRRLVVTSAGPREGKTVTAVSVATVMAQSDTRVLLVDSDMRRPRIHKVFGGKNDVGMTSLLLGEASFDEAIQKTAVPNLDVLYCGPIPPNPSELIHTKRFVELLDAFNDRYDMVILDSPPTIAVADSMILSSIVDGLLFVVSGGQTSKEMSVRARNRLAGVNAPILGCILNNVDLADRQYGYYYYYYRKYGEYYGEAEDHDELEATA